MILKVAGNRYKMENFKGTMAGKESFLRMLDAKKIARRYLEGMERQQT